MEWSINGGIHSLCCVLWFQLPFNLSSQNSDEDGDDDDDDDDDEGETVDSTSYKTPSSRTPSSRYRPLGPLPISTTPGTEFISPSLLQQVNRWVHFTQYNRLTDETKSVIMIKNNDWEVIRECYLMQFMLCTKRPGHFRVTLRFFFKTSLC